MRQFDLTPLYRSTVGFDRLFSLLDNQTGVNQTPSYPPYNIERVTDDEYRITMAVAGFKEDELTVEVKENTLTVTGAKAETDDNNENMLYRGIAARAFERRFQLADHVFVTGAALDHGLLHVSLKREVPEAKKPRIVQIEGGTKAIDASAS
ncbi:Hsp20 family protein [Acuticoccus sp. MNP-M23]|uniref:Hsp20 family protein n=1 Tax=Acuticoccus sp. MNP-M23 TaxID=3072793 RepID=UPI0028158ABC|nr:Hsp20 family protein [Acuticoccus sp. MNP-M23]WMS41297.1 Hsp20 family protein [Acuticoccus sp. MNP-M23]